MDNKSRKYIDENTGRTIWQLTDLDAEIRHTYYDVCPWDPDDKRIVFSVAESTESNKGKVCIMDENGGKIQVIADDAVFNPHHGSGAAWGADGRNIYYIVNRNGQNLDMVEIDTGNKQQVTDFIGMTYIGNMMISPDGEKIVFNAKSKKKGLYSIYMMDNSGNNLHKIVTTDEIREISPSSDKLGDTYSIIMHPKWNPDCQSLFFVHSNELSIKPPTVKELYYLGLNDSDKNYICDFGHHPSWHPDGKKIIFYDFLEPDWGEQRLFIVNKDGTGRKVLIPEKDGGSHPLVNPRNYNITSDCYHGLYENSIILMDPEQKTIEKLATVNIKDHSHQGTHMHPTWNHQGTKILYNSDQTGKGQLYLIDLEKK